VYETTDAVIESSETSPVEAPAAETVDDKET
jgi:hypothetical protein